MRRSRFPYMVLAAMLMVEYAVQGAEGARKEKGHPRNELSAPQTAVDIVMTKEGSELLPLRQATTLTRD